MLEQLSCTIQRFYNVQIHGLFYVDSISDDINLHPRRTCPVLSKTLRATPRHHWYVGFLPKDFFTENYRALQEFLSCHIFALSMHHLRQIAHS